MGQWVVLYNQHWLAVGGEAVAGSPPLVVIPLPVYAFPAAVRAPEFGIELALLLLFLSRPQSELLNLELALLLLFLSGVLVIVSLNRTVQYSTAVFLFSCL